MPVSVIIGGQYGSEGKGKVTHYFAKKLNAAAVIRVGGPNSGHTVISDYGLPLIFKHLSTASIIPGVKCVLTAGNFLNPEILFQEIEMAAIDERDLLIDPFAVIITDEHRELEKTAGIISNIGSTGCGLGAAITDKISRTRNIVFAKDVPALGKYIVETNPYLRKLLNRKERILIEGTQGFGLSILHSNVYPYCTSRDTTAAGFVAEAGLSPMDVDDVIMVIRAFPIRVAGNSGPLKNETTWEEVSINSGSPEPFYELTSVSKKIRRIAEFDRDIVCRALSYNQPTKIVLNHTDFFDLTSNGKLSPVIIRKTQEIENLICRNIDYIGINRNEISDFKVKSGYHGAVR